VINTDLSNNQARRYADMIADVFSAAMESGKPADRILAAYFRQNKKCGSKDRRAMRETLFSLFRWWGWLGPSMGTGGTWARQLFLAHLLDAEEPEHYALRWKEAAGIKAHVPGMANYTMDDRAQAIGEILRRQLNATDLAPNWTTDRLPLEGADLKRFHSFLCKRPPMWIRVQRDDVKGVLQELKAVNIDPVRPSDSLPAASLGLPRKNLYELEAYRKGRFEVQDFASQMIGYSCMPAPGERWWDACAGAGGKTLQLAALMKNKGCIVASDIREYKLLDLKKRARRGGFSNISPKPWPKRKIPVPAKGFDGVLVDAPCSCSGTWRRNPDARWTTTPETPDEMAAIQLDILTRCKKAVKTNGVLVYATCSFCKVENQDVVDAFLAENTDFELEPFAHPVTGEETDGTIFTMPWEYDTDMTFVARMRRK
jgi:16S rRNA (cytosine967-C5)-methyltransferase